MPWLTEVISFEKSSQKRVLELGCGPGYDAFTFCKNGADYTGLDITPLNLLRTRQHLNFYDLHPNVLIGDAENLMFADGDFDIVFSNGVLHHTPDIQKSFREAYRVLKSGGEFQVIIYHRDSIVYWINYWLIQHILRGKFRKQSFQDTLAAVEYTSSDERPLVNAYSRRQVRQLLKKAGFSVETVKVRKLLQEDLPTNALRIIWKRIPQSWLNQVGKLFGWYVIAIARKED